MNNEYQYKHSVHHFLFTSSFCSEQVGNVKILGSFLLCWFLCYFCQILAGNTSLMYHQVMALIEWRLIPLLFILHSYSKNNGKDVCPVVEIGNGIRPRKHICQNASKYVRIWKNCFFTIDLHQGLWIQLFLGFAL